LPIVAVELRDGIASIVGALKGHYPRALRTSIMTYVYICTDHGTLLGYGQFVNTVWGRPWRQASGAGRSTYQLGETSPSDLASQPCKEAMSSDVNTDQIRVGGTIRIQTLLTKICRPPPEGGAPPKPPAKPPRPGGPS
jgi:hypothetical protein